MVQFMRRKLKPHLMPRNIVGALVGMLLIFSLLTPVIYTYLYIAETLSQKEEANSSVTEWYEYYRIIPTKTAFAKGETISFNSFIHYKHNMQMRWEDTLFCQQGEGQRKYNTQIWPQGGGYEFKSEGLVNMEKDNEGVLRLEKEQLEYWDYTAEAIAEDATECFLSSVIVGMTPNGFKKPYFYVTEPFLVNQ